MEIPGLLCDLQYICITPSRKKRVQTLIPSTTSTDFMLDIFISVSPLVCTPQGSYHVMIFLALFSFNCFANRYGITYCRTITIQVFFIPRRMKSGHFSLHEPQHSITVYKRIVPRHINGLDRKAFSLQFVVLLACAFFSLLFRVTPKTSVLFSRNGFP